jgi:superfamily II DNA or RNA helicase
MQAIAYCVNVKHSKSICQLFNDNGIPAMHLDGTSNEAYRNEVMNDFKAGKFKILCNCNLISEGITVPECDCCMLLRPTQSETLYIQQACRCLTPRKDKRAIIIDFVGNCYAHGTPTEPREYTLDSTIKVRNSSREPEVLVRQCKNCLRVYKGTSPVCPYCDYNNGKTQKQIQEDEKAELEEFKRRERMEKRREVGRETTLEGLIAIGRKRHYKDPEYWARMVLKNRNRRT